MERQVIPPGFLQDRRSAKVDKASLGGKAAAPFEHEQERFKGSLQLRWQRIPASCRAAQRSAARHATAFPYHLMRSPISVSS